MSFFENWRSSARAESMMRWVFIILVAVQLTSTTTSTRNTEEGLGGRIRSRFIAITPEILEVYVVKPRILLLRVMNYAGADYSTALPLW